MRSSSEADRAHTAAFTSNHVGAADDRQQRKEKVGRVRAIHAVRRHRRGASARLAEANRARSSQRKARGDRHEPRAPAPRRGRPGPLLCLRQGRGSGQPTTRPCSTLRVPSSRSTTESQANSGTKDQHPEGIDGLQERRRQGGTTAQDQLVPASVKVQPVRNRGEERGRRRRGKATDFRFCRDRTPPTCLPVSSSSDPTASGEALTCPYLRVRVVACSTKPLLAILLAKRTAWKKAQPVTQDAAWTIYSMRGRAGAEGLGRALRHPPPAARVARPRHFTFAHQLRVFQCLLQKANGPVPDPEPFPRRSIGPTTGARAE